MEKNEVLAELIQKAKDQGISKEEFVTAYDSEVYSSVSNISHKSLDLSKVLYYIGGAIVFLGISVLLYQNWDSFGYVVKILVTLGVACTAYIVGVIFSKYPEYYGASDSFFLK